MRQFARPFPVFAIARVLGLTHLGPDRLLAWSEAIGEVLEPGASAAAQRAGDAALDSMAACLAEEVAVRRGGAVDDVLAGLIDGGPRAAERRAAARLDRPVVPVGQ
ncbi:hypothetical protein GCM10020218_080770 [Dactylosporangium vinaceum]